MLHGLARTSLARVTTSQCTTHTKALLSSLSVLSLRAVFVFILQVGGLRDVVHVLARTSLARGHNATWYQR